LPPRQKKKVVDLLDIDHFAKTYGIPNHSDKLPVVLVHGDIQPMNILFSDQENDKDRLVGLIDWQLAHKGYGPEDFARLFAICATTEFKRKHGDEILRRYVDVFNAKIKGTALKPIRFEDVKSVFTEMYLVMALSFATGIRVADQLVEAIADKDEKERQRLAFQNHCEDLYRDVAETLGW